MSDDKTRIAGRHSVIDIGTELNQTYRIDTPIGVGGMGEVFKGHNIQTGDPVAIKIVLPEFARDEMIIGLFRKEARILNHLNHDAIVRYYVFSIDPAIERPYLAMEFVDGPSLAAHVKSTPLAGGDFMPLLRRLADGLHKAHEAGIIHRDMSPDNVILPGGSVKDAKIIDFGIARSANVGGGTLLGGSFAGKYSYVSPEQLGLYGGEVTPKSDIYSLALVMAAAIRGSPIDMGGSQADVIDKRRKVPDLTGIPKQFQALLTAMLQPDPDRRPANMAEVRDWPEEKVGGRGKSATPAEAGSKSSTGKTGRSSASSAPAPPSSAMRNVVMVIAAVLVAGVGALGGWIFVKERSGSPQPAASAQTQTPAATSAAPAETPAPPPPQTEAAADTKPVTTSNASVEAAPPAHTAEQNQPDQQPSVQTPNPDTAAQSPPAQPEKTAESQAEATPAQQPSTQTPSVGASSSPEPSKSTTDSQTATPPAPPVTQPVETTKPPDQQTASLEPQPLPGKEAPTADQLRDFVATYVLGKCLVPITVTLGDHNATIAALGSAASGKDLTDGFIAKAGFAPELALDEVAPSQCALLSQFHGMSTSDAAPIALKLASSEIRGNNADTGAAGDPLNISITGVSQRNLYLFVMDHNGGIQNINRLCPACIVTKPDETTAALTLYSPTLAAGETAPPFYPELVFAVASAKPLITINAQDAYDPDDFIPPFLKEVAAGSDITTALAYVRLKPQ